jgi:hypothetical protein
MSIRRTFESDAARFIVAACLLWLPVAGISQEVIVHLKNGDRLTGRIVSQETNRLVLSVQSLGEISVPIQSISKREVLPAPASAPETKTVAAKPPQQQSPKPAPKAAPKPPEKKSAPKYWKANVKVGSDFLFSQRDRELYYSRIKVTYDHPLSEDPKRSFRATADYNVDYGKTDGVTSTDRMGGTLKADMDVNERLFFYSLGGGGYDAGRKIDLQYEAGPGAGYHVFTRPKIRLNTEGGVNYAAQDRVGNQDVKNFYLRLAHDLTWKITPRISLTHAAEFFPRAESFEEYRARLDTTLSFGLTKSLSLNLSVLDLYDTDPANRVNNNELQIRSSVGVTF